MSDTEQRALVPVKYVGKKAEKTDNVAGTGLVWTPGQIHIVPPLVAQKLSRHADIWKIVDDEVVDQDPAQVGLVVTQTDIADTNSAGQHPTPQTIDLPNLAGMTRPDIAAFAATQFNVKLAANMKKEDMVQQVVTLSNSRAAGELE